MRGARLGAILALAGAILIALPAQFVKGASADVAALQIAMREAGLYPHQVDGITGPLTRSAVSDFQRRNGLAADGIAGPRTRAQLGRWGEPELGSRLLRKGDRGWDVAALQFLLDSRGFGEGGLDGDFGAVTDLAVRKFQKAADLAADGVAGTATLKALRTEELSEEPTGPVRFLRPLRSAIGDGFGYPGGRRHTGLDFPAPMGAPLGAAGVGVVGFAGWNSGGYGNLVVVKHRLGYETWYAHLSTIAVSAGQAVTGGGRIGSVGSTGRSTGPHLHFEVRHFGTPIEPVPYLLTSSAARVAPSPARKLLCRPNADVRGGGDADPWKARIGRCP